MNDDDNDSGSDSDTQPTDNLDINDLITRTEGLSYQYQYLDHPADVILVGEGSSIRDALQSISVSMFNYMSDLSLVDATHHKQLRISGRGLLNLLYHLLDECLYLYSSEYFIAKHVLIEDDLVLPPLESPDEFNNHEFSIRVMAIGDYFNKLKHTSGTEIKAITMHYRSFELWLGDLCYEYNNDMESHQHTQDLLSALRNDHRITRCKVYCLVDI